MEKTYRKIDDLNLEIKTTRERVEVIGKQDLLDKKARIQARLAEVNAELNQLK